MEQKLSSIGDDTKAKIYRQLKKWFFISLFLHVIAAVFSLGFYHYDEHYQILEFAGLKAGLTTAQALPWEYAAHIRPSIQPWIAYLFIRLFGFFGQHDTFMIAMGLRMLSGLLGWAVSLFMTIVFLPCITPYWAKKVFILLNTFLWFLVFVHIRYSSESWSSAFFFIGLCMLVLQIRKNEQGDKPFSVAALLGTGFIFGLSFIFRFQTGLLLPGLFLWALVFRKINFPRLMLLGAGILAAIAFGFLLDKLYYGEWVNTAYEYFKVNLMEGKAASFGVSPWYFYFVSFARDAVLPFGILILLLSLVAFLRYPRNIVFWACIPFLIAHLFIGHKELRFLFPLVPAIPLFISLALNEIELQNWKEHKMAYKTLIFGLLGALFLAYNTIHLYEVLFTTPQTVFRPLHYIYKHYQGKQVAILLNDKYQYMLLTGLPMNFYVRPNMHPRMVWSQASIDSILREKGPEKQMLFMIYSHGLTTPPEIANNGLVCNKMVYSEIPAFVEKLNFNHWVERTSIWKVYACEPEEKN